MTRVLHLMPRVFVAGAAGGGERYSAELVVAQQSSDGLDVSTLVGESPRHLTYSVEGTPIGRKIPMRQAFAVMGQYDILHVHQLNSVIADLAFIYAHTNPSARLVLTDHGGGWRSPGRLLGVTRFSAFHSLAAVSQTSIGDLGWPARKPAVVLYGGASHLGPPSGVSAQNRPYDFVYVGRLVPHKGVVELLKALPDGATLLIAGAPLDPAYVDLVGRLARSRSVELHLEPSDTEVAEAFRSARCAVVPSQEMVEGKRLRRPELLGLTALESYWSGCRTVVTPLPAFREIAPLIGAFVSDGFDHLRLNATLTAVMANPLRTGTVGREFFSWRAVAGRCSSAYGLAQQTASCPKRI